MSEPLRRLPAEPVDRLVKPFAHFLRIEAAAGGVLLLFVLLAVISANSPWSAPYLSIWEVPVGLHFGGLEFSRSLKHWINDGLMTFFFFVVALELKREFVVGELRSPRMALMSLSAALGGMVVPAGIYLLMMSGRESMHGWGTVMATDTAFLIGCLAILGSRIPLSLRLFLLSLAVFDDVGAILVVAIGYGSDLNWGAIILAGTGLLVILALARLGVRNIPLYFLIGGVIWVALDASGFHATMAGVILGLMTPARSWVSDQRLHAILRRVTDYPPGDHWSGDSDDRKDLQSAAIATRETLSPVERLEMGLHPWVAFIVMPLFVAANAGVPISAGNLDSGLIAAVVLAFVIGKPLGVVLFTFLSLRLRLATLPPGLDLGLVAGGGLLTGIGFTMAIFIAEMAFPAALLNSAKLGIMGASLLAGSLGLAALAWLTRSSSRPGTRQQPVESKQSNVVYCRNGS